jgi:hypothetical protein
MVGVLVMFNSMFGGETLLKLLADPSAITKTTFVFPIRLFNEAEPFQPVLPKPSNSVNELKNSASVNCL